MKAFARFLLAGLICTASFAGAGAYANDYRQMGKLVKIGGSNLAVTPPRDWNMLTVKPGKFVETWTLDGEQLNDLTIFAGIGAGQPLVKETNKKNAPLPKFTASTLLVEVPELLENTYRAYKQIGSFSLTQSTPIRFLNRDGIGFTYTYIDKDELPRKGEARAVVVAKKLYMITFEAPRLHYFDRNIADFRALADTATLPD